jgi:hypothetical protein
LPRITFSYEAQDHADSGTSSFFLLASATFG